MKSTRRFLIILAVISALVLSACGKKTTNTDPTPTSPDSSVTDPNIPDNVVAPTTQSTSGEDIPVVTSAATEAPIVSAAPDDTSSAEPNEPKKTASAETDPPEENIVADDLDDTKAMEYLKLLNSRRVHAKLTEMYSFDGDELFSAEREYFISGSDKIYINDDSKTIIRGGTATYIDYASEIYYSCPDDTQGSQEFGFEPDKYVLISSEDTENGTSEIYNIEGEGIVSTWEFGADGKLRVSDRKLDSAMFNYYMFEIIDGGSPEMDFSIPENFTEVSAEDYGFFN